MRSSTRSTTPSAASFRPPSPPPPDVRRPSRRCRRRRRRDDKCGAASGSASAGRTVDRHDGGPVPIMKRTSCCAEHLNELAWSRSLRRSIALLRECLCCEPKYHHINITSPSRQPHQWSADHDHLLLAWTPPRQLAIGRPQWAIPTPAEWCCRAEWCCAVLFVHLGAAATRLSARALTNEHWCCCGSCVL